jgi:hypothetical protein
MIFARPWTSGRRIPTSWQCRPGLLQLNIMQQKARKLTFSDSRHMIVHCLGRKKCPLLLVCLQPSIWLLSHLNYFSIPRQRLDWLLTHFFVGWWAFMFSFYLLALGSICFMWPCGYDSTAWCSEPVLVSMPCSKWETC